ncbi:alpha/beta fold hydrolase [Nocardioides sp.]|uniref:alpha/beta fold hydrolase n=1 Tax=Nocardioides sp. TaxID=35761 RepID=UPI003D12D804
MLVSTVSLAALLPWWRPGSTEPFLDDNGHRLPQSISEKLSVPVNGVLQGMVIRGENTSNPVLLWVHGGPGMPDYPLTQQYPTDLEDLFTVVWWDQRGAALSYASDIPPETMTIEQFIDDTLTVTDYLRDRFDQDQIYLLGHSWGSFIALQAAARSPERFKAYLGMAQTVYQLESEKIAHDYMLAAYKKRRDAGMVRDLERAPVTMSTGTPEAYLKLRDSAMHRLGIGTTHDMTSVITGIFLASWRFRGYTLREKVRLWRGRAFSRSFGLWDQLIRADLRETVPALQIPVYFLEGKYDYTCVTSLARDYFEKLQAPVKGFYVFDNSAHSPLLEEPRAAHRILEHDVLAGATTLADLR